MRGLTLSLLHVLNNGPYLRELLVVLYSSPAVAQLVGALKTEQGMERE